MREHILTYLGGVNFRKELNCPNILQACAAVLMVGGLMGCAGPGASLFGDTTSRIGDSSSSHDALNTVRKADLSPRFPTAEEQPQASGQTAKPLLFPGADVGPDVVPSCNGLATAMK